MHTAIGGRPSVALLDAADVTDADAASMGTDQVVQEYLPLLSDAGDPLAVVACGATPRRCCSARRRPA